VDSSDRWLRGPTALPVNNGQVVRVHRPFELVLFGLELLQLHRQNALVDLSFGEDTEMARESKLVAKCDEPFGWVPLIPFHSVPVVHRELVMKVVVPLPKGHERSDEMVSGSVLVVECAFAQPMSQRVDGKGRLRIFISANLTSIEMVWNPYVMNNNDPKETGIEVSTAPVAPKVPRNRRGDDDPPNQRNRKIVLILPLHNGVLAQVADISWSRLDPRFHEHPHNVRLHPKISRQPNKQGLPLTHQKPRSAL